MLITKAIRIEFQAVLCVTDLDLFDCFFRRQVDHAVHLSVHPGLHRGARVPVLLPEVARALIPGAKGVQFGPSVLPSLYGLIYRGVDLLADLCGATLPQRLGGST